MRKLLILLVFTTLSVNAGPISERMGDVELLADHHHYQLDRLFLVVHGTWAHKDMDIIKSMQNVLDEYEESSLAVTLSLDISRREGFYPCDVPVTHRYEDAVSEIEIWMSWAEAQGYREIVLVGHSRGAAQVLLFDRLDSRAEISSLVLLGPMMFEPDRFEPVSSQKLANVFHCENVSMSPESYASYFGPEPVKNSARLLAEEGNSSIVFLGTQDPVTDKFYADFQPKDTVRTIRIEGADHFFRDLYMDEVVEIMLETIP